MLVVAAAATTTGESIASTSFLQVALVSISSQVSNILLQHQKALQGKLLSIPSSRPFEMSNKVPMTLQCAAYSGVTLLYKSFNFGGASRTTQNRIHALYYGLNSTTDM